MNMQELYELTVNAYKAGLADEFLDNDERDVRDRGRFNNRNHSFDSPVRVNGGYPTRSGSVVRFSGEDEVAYDLQRMSSDGSNTSGSRRSNSLPRYHGGGNEEAGNEDFCDNEDGDDEKGNYQNRRQLQLQQQQQQQQQQYQQATMASRQTSTPMIQKSVTVDGRYGKGSKPTIVIPVSVEQQMLKSRRQEFEKELGISSSPTRSNHRSKSVDPRLMDGSNGSNKRSTLSPTGIKSVQQQQSVFSISGFRTNSRESATESLFEDNKTRREREAAEKKATASVTKPVGSEKAKQYLLSTLFGSGGKMPTIPAFGAEAKSVANVTSTPMATRESGSPTVGVEASRNIQASEANTPPNNTSAWTAPSYLTSSETRTTTATNSTSASVVQATATLGSTSGTTPSSTTASSSYTISNKTSVSYLDSPPILSPTTAATKSLPLVSQLNTPPTMSPIDFSSVLPPPPPPPSMPPPQPGSTLANRTSSTNSSIMSHHQPTLQLSPHIELMSNAMMSKLEELRSGIDKVRGGVGATASSLGFYDEMNETGGVIVLENRERVKRDLELEDSDSSDEVALVVKGRGKESGGSSSQKRDVVKGLDSFAAAVATAATAPVQPKDEVAGLRPPSRNGSSPSTGTSVTSATTITTTAVKSPLLSSSSSSPAATPLSPTSSSSTAAPTTIRTRSSHGRMSANAASLGNSLMQSLQSSPAYQNAAQKKSDREKVILAAAAIAETLQKMEPVVLATPTSTTPRRSLVPSADSGGAGAVRSTVGGFEALKKL
ncbi:UNVERIFIED_CONTAM: hypothetical protein HDU68_004600 [Siphonaria sp. JEL0065]|nr:hypothetical protein HDU68_004600 [Siphonaria sp. JEL0065]